MIPLVFLAAFNHPAADDFTIAYVLKTEGIIDSQIYWYLSWSGRYVSTAIISFLHPLSYNSFLLYRIYPVILLLLSWWSICFLLGSILPTSNKLFRWAYSGVLHINFLSILPSMVEGFYWFPAAFIYMLANIFTILFIAFIIRYERDKKANTLIAGVIFAILSLGSNEINLLVVNEIIACWIAISWINKTKQWFPRLVSFGLIIFFSCLSLFSPGNMNRANEIKSVSENINFNLGEAISSCFQQNFSNLFEWSFLSPLCVVGILSLLFINDFHQKIAYKVNPLVIWLGIFFVFAALYFPFYYGAGVSEASLYYPNRVLNVICYFYCIAFPFAFIYTILWILQRKKIEGYILDSVNKKIIPFSVLVFIILISSAGNIKQAFKDIRSRDFLVYHRSLNHRYKLIEKSNQDTLVVDSLKFFPKTLYFSDISADPKDWKNAPYANYFSKEMIVLKP